MSDTRRQFKREQEVRSIGGRLASDYYDLKRDIVYLNDYFFGLFSSLQLTDDIDLVIDTLNNKFKNLCEAFISKRLEDIEKGNIPKDNFLSSRMRKQIEGLPPEEKQKVWLRETKRALKLMYTKTIQDYKKENKLYYLEPRHSKTALEISRKALFLTPSGIEIDGEKFAKIYSGYIEAEQSETYKKHKMVAETINKFFNGSVAITQKELSKYFILEDGKVKENPNSINIKDYARLGVRKVRTTLKKNGE